MIKGLLCNVVFYFSSTTARLLGLTLYLLQVFLGVAFSVTSFNGFCHATVKRHKQTSVILELSLFITTKL